MRLLDICGSKTTKARAPKVTETEVQLWLEILALPLASQFSMPREVYCGSRLSMDTLAGASEAIGPNFDRLEHFCGWKG